MNNYKIFNPIILTNLSKEKFNRLNINYYDNNNIDNLYSLLEQMSSAFKKEIKIILANQLDIHTFKETFIDFDKHINGVDKSKFQSDIINMNNSMSVDLVVDRSIIRINFLFDNFNENKNYMAVILHALNTFCYLFCYNYNGLIIDISLDNNHRINVLEIASPVDYDIFFYQLKKKSSAFSVGGVTYRTNKKILLTKKEELVKLMFHELIHYIGLDHEILNIKNYFNLSVNRNNFNLSEAYTELISVILNTGHETLHIISHESTKLNKYELFNYLLKYELNYSLYLTSNVLKFYGYDNNTYVDFFKGIGEKKYCPIYIWEYVILKTQLFLNLGDLLNITKNDFRITPKNKNEIADLMKIDNNLINKLAIFMSNTEKSQYFSYTMFDFNWNLF